MFPLDFESCAALLSVIALLASAEVPHAKERQVEPTSSQSEGLFVLFCTLSSSNMFNTRDSSFPRQCLMRTLQYASKNCSLRDAKYFLHILQKQAAF